MRKRFPNVQSGTFVAAAFLLYEVLVFWVLTPLHRCGVGQSVIGFLNGFDQLLRFPGFVAAMFLGVSGYRQAPNGIAITLLNLPVYFFLGFLLGRRLIKREPGSATMPSDREKSRKPAASDSNKPAWTRRQFLNQSVKLSAGGAAVGLGYAVVVEPRWFDVTWRRIPLRGLPPELDGLRAVQLTDIHHGPWLALGYVRQIVDRTNSLVPDVVLLTGDYVLRSPDYIEPAMHELARLKAKIGAVAVLGNHDWYEGAARIRKLLQDAGISAIDNCRRFITPGRQIVEEAREGLCLAGVGDLWEDRQDYARALSDVPGDMPRLLLSHNPDVAEDPALLRSGFRVDLQISGHTHGGQVRLPFAGAVLTPSRFGRKYAQGLVQGPVCPVFISRGIGVSMLPTRLGVRPEIAVLEFTTAEIS